MGYETDLTKEQWELIAPHFRHGKWENRAKYPKRDLVNAVLYFNKTRCQWYLLPKDFPPYSTVWSFYRRFCTLFNVPQMGLNPSPSKRNL